MTAFRGPAKLFFRFRTTPPCDFVTRGACFGLSWPTSRLLSATSERDRSLAWSMRFRGARAGWAASTRLHKLLTHTVWPIPCARTGLASLWGWALSRSNRTSLKLRSPRCSNKSEMSWSYMNSWQSLDVQYCSSTRTSGSSCDNNSSCFRPYTASPTTPRLPAGPLWHFNNYLTIFV